MGNQGQGEPDCPPQERPVVPGDTKKNDAPLLTEIERLCKRALRQTDRRVASRMCEHIIAQLVCMGTHTVTGLLCTRGRQFEDWSADYRLYEHSRVCPGQLFEPVREAVCANTEGPVITAMDDTQLRKTGKKTHGVKYMRDPMGPPFHPNFITAQRFVQTSMAWKGPDGQARMIPVDWVHAPVPAKPKAGADEKQLQAYRTAKKQCSAAMVGAQRIRELRRWLNEHGAQKRTLWCTVDGSYTNGTVLKSLPENTTLVGRIRADAKLHYLPNEQPGTGRRRVYGEQAPTPEQVRKDKTIAWRHVKVFFGGKRRELRAKRLRPLRWRTAGKEHNLQLLVLAPTPYRLTKNTKLLYRKPAYLICTDPDAPLTDVIQYYLWRWDIEVNFRDQKTLLGVGEAQVRTKEAVQNLTGCAVAAYAMLLTAAATSHKNGSPTDHLSPPKWHRKKTNRATTMNLIQNLRQELWAKALRFSDFVTKSPDDTKSQKLASALQSAVCYASRFS